MDPATVRPAPLRKDIVEVPQKYLGRSFIIFKNPISLAYYRLSLAHAEAARKFDGRRTALQILEELREDSRYWRSLPRDAAVKELATLGQQLGMGGLLQTRGGSAVKRAEQLRKAKKARRFELGVAQTLYFRKSLCDPDAMLEKITPWFAWCFTRTFVTLVTVLFVITVVAVARQGEALFELGANFFTLENLAVSWLIFFVVKIIHEFGHAISCKHFGGEVHEMGFMFILFTPYLFVNVSDSWLASKSRRIWVGSAGIFVELILACIAAWIWLATSPGLAHQLAFNTMFLASISTVLFNANPLLKFDGYYMLTDAIEIPNLKQKSNAYISYWAQRYLLGMQGAQLRLTTYEMKPAFGVYAVLSYLYGWFIIYNISLILFNILEPIGLNFLSRTYVALFLFTSLVIPLYRLMKTVSTTSEFQPVVVPRLRRFAIGLLALIALTFVIPWNDTIKRSAVLEHAKIEPVTSKAPGFLRSVYVTEGQQVKAGTILGRLQNPDLETEKAILELEHEAVQVRYRDALTHPDPHVRNSAAAMDRMKKEIEEQLAGVEERMEDLILRSSADGIVRTRRPAELKGYFFQPGQPIFEIGHTDGYRVVIALSEQEARRVGPGQDVTVRFASLPGEKLQGTIVREPVAGLEFFSTPILANLIGGDVPSEPDPEVGFRPTVAYYEAEMLTPTAPPQSRAGMLGKARIHAGRSTLGRWTIERLMEQIDPSVRM
jgi:putative peptide zinc metalloprotease protein